MKAQKSTIAVLALLLLGAPQFAFNSRATAAGPGKNFTNHRGGQASAHMSAKGSANSNAQWSADPTRGWIRADERHELSKTSVPTQNKSDKVKPKAKTKASGY